MKDAREVALEIIATYGLDLGRITALITAYGERVRREALEEAAKTARDALLPYEGPGSIGRNHGLSEMIGRLRALADTPRDGGEK